MVREDGKSTGIGKIMKPMNCYILTLMAAFGFHDCGIFISCFYFAIKLCCILNGNMIEFSGIIIANVIICTMVVYHALGGIPAEATVE